MIETGRGTGQAPGKHSWQVRQMVGLHATPEGQRLYEKAGFRLSNEMRLRLDC